MPEYADQPLPSLPFFFTQSTAEIRDQQQLVGHAAFAKRSLLNRPATFPSWEAHTHSAPTGLGQKAVEFQVMSAAPNHAFLSYAHELLAGAVYDAEALLRIESKDRHIDLHQNTVEAFERDVAQDEPVLELLSPNDDWHWLRYPFLREGDSLEKRHAVRNYLRDHGYSYTPALAISGSLHVLAFIVICIGIPRIQALRV